MVVSEGWLSTLPKVELHAHLSGSIPQAFLARQSLTRGMRFEGVDVVQQRSLALCFEYFKAVNGVIDDLDGLEAATREVLGSYAAEACMYLELRTTPKALGGATEVEYVRTVESVAAEFGESPMVKLLLSLDRSKVDSMETAEERIDSLLALARTFPDFVVGLDVSGDPRAKTATQFVLPALASRRPLGLPITFHTGEVRDDEEVNAILDAAGELGIRRLGHCCFVPEDVDVPSDIGIELCPTSNLVAMQLDDLSAHTFGRYRGRRRLSINTDDRGLFDCSLTSELADLANAFDLDEHDIIDLQRQAIRSSFNPDPEALLDTFRVRLQQQQQQREESSRRSPAN